MDANLSLTDRRLGLAQIDVVNQANDIGEIDLVVTGTDRIAFNT